VEGEWLASLEEKDMWSWLGEVEARLGKREPWAEMSSFWENKK
jgi:hypothetical protein